MKKHDEGYVLVYVTVVLLVFCLVATMILTGAHRNLQNQQKTIEQMKDQYAAEGMIEKVMAEWNTHKTNVTKDSDVGDTGVRCIDKDDTTVTLYAESGGTSVTCVVQLSDGKYISYNIGTAETEPTESEPAVIGGDS